MKPITLFDIPLRFLKWYTRRNPNIFYLELCVTWRCNARCKMCGIWKKPKGYEMTLEDYDRLSKDRTLGKLREFDCTGGETFLRSDLEDVVKIFCKDHKIEKMVFPTNGFLTDRILDFYHSIRNFYKGDLTIGISVDGVGLAHDVIRGVNNAFNRAYATYHELRKIAKKDRKFHTGAYATIIGEENINEIPLLRKIFNPFSFRLSCFNPNLANEEKWMFHTPEIVSKYEKYLSIYGSNSDMSRYIQQFLPIYHGLKPFQFIPCKISVHGSVYIHPNGDVYPCVESWDSHFLGNCLKHSLNDILTSKKARKVKASIDRGECWCIADCMFTRNIWLDPKYYVYVLKRRMQGIRR